MTHRITKEEVFEVVKRNILEILPDVAPDTVSLDRSLVDLGANSVDRMEVVTLSMEALDLKIPLMSFARVDNIEGLVAVLFEHVR
ncbi:MAG: phosphopantetheine-binding protein [Alphaproteobacteria bacterium]|nr:phosphopantetheine-binding protein [Alphaproteobacteria bacterium]